MKGVAKCSTIILVAAMMVVTGCATEGIREGAVTMPQPSNEIKVEERGLIGWFAFNCHQSSLIIGRDGASPEEIAIDWARVDFKGGKAVLSLKDRKMRFDMSPNRTFSRKQGSPEALVVASIEFVGQEVLLHSSNGVKERLPKAYIQVLPSQKLLYVREPKGNDTVWEKWYNVGAASSR